MASRNIKNQILEVSRDYLGPAAERFIDRQIKTHLHKNPDSVSHQDIYKLIDWLKLSLALLTKDTDMVDEYSERLRLIAEGKSREALEGEWQR